ncbi:hypothetical protein [Pararhizobium sp. DWP1-1-3]|uniref:hypothetical protein n=1 Tax=Pararhizobium sp. DWP1-1-3 TaxID=2804652 RepID=UPI003CFADD5F
MSASLEADFEKEGQKAVLFSIIASVLSIIDSAERKISVAGISIDLKEQFLINGAFCALAIYFGVAVFLTGLRLYGAGWPRGFQLFYKRYIFRRRNKSEAGKYKPRRVKFEVRCICFMFNTSLLFAGGWVFVIYVYGIFSTFPDLVKIISLLLEKLFP